MSGDGRTTEPSDLPSPDSHACPECGGTGLVRVRRRFIDRVASVFFGLRRFRCTHAGCHWEGNLRSKSKKI